VALVEKKYFLYLRDKQFPFSGMMDRANQQADFFQKT
jgi:phenylalanine-4-hydroxylase